MTSVAPAQNGAFMHIPTKTPRVHGLTTPTHARRRAGHPLAGGRLGKQNAVGTILGRLVISSRKNVSIFEDAVRPSGKRILTRWSLNDVHTHSRNLYAERLEGL